MADISPMMTTAHHVTQGQVVMYKVDAHSAAANFPDEWSLTPWDPQSAAESRQRIADRHAAEVEEAKAKGLQPPASPLPPEPPPLTPEEEAAIEQYNAAVAEAQQRLDAWREEQAKRKAELDQIAADEALIAQGPPQPDPNRRRPLAGTAKANAERKAAADAERKAEEDRLAAEKATADRGVALPPANPKPVARTTDKSV